MNLFSHKSKHSIGMTKEPSEAPVDLMEIYKKVQMKKEANDIWKKIQEKKKKENEK